MLAAQRQHGPDLLVSTSFCVPPPPLGLSSGPDFGPNLARVGHGNGGRGRADPFQFITSLINSLYVPEVH